MRIPPTPPPHPFHGLAWSPACLPACIQVPHTLRAQTRVLFAERHALLMKGYEATRRNMAILYLRSERSDLNLRICQVGGVEWGWMDGLLQCSDENMVRMLEHFFDLFFRAGCEWPTLDLVDIGSRWLGGSCPRLVVGPASVCRTQVAGGIV